MVENKYKIVIQMPTGYINKKQGKLTETTETYSSFISRNVHRLYGSQNSYFVFC